MAFSDVKIRITGSDCHIRNLVAHPDLPTGDPLRASFHRVIFRGFFWHLPEYVLERDRATNEGLKRHFSGHDLPGFCRFQGRNKRIEKIRARFFANKTQNRSREGVNGGDFSLFFSSSVTFALQFDILNTPDPSDMDRKF